MHLLPVVHWLTRACVRAYAPKKAAVPVGNPVCMQRQIYACIRTFFSPVVTHGHSRCQGITFLYLHPHSFGGEQGVTNETIVFLPVCSFFTGGVASIHWSSLGPFENGSYEEPVVALW